jgi:hypothetical protein
VQSVTVVIRLTIYSTITIFVGQALAIIAGTGGEQYTLVKNIPVPEFIDPVFAKTSPKRSF